MSGRSVLAAVRPHGGAVRCLLHCGLAALSAFSAEATASATVHDAPDSKVRSVAWAHGAVTIDGEIAPAEWEGAAVVDDFHQIDPGDGTPPSERTEVRLMRDGRFLYVAVQAFDSRPDLVRASQLVQKRPIAADDRFSIMIDTFNSRRNDYFFQVNPNGVTRDAIRESNSRFLPDWDGIWLASARRTDVGWQAEIAIPFRSIAYRAGNDVWGVNFSRIIARKRETLAWTSGNRSIMPAYHGTLTGMSTPSAASAIDIIGYTTARSSRSGPLTSEQSVDVSGDIQWRPRPSIGAVLSFNTDFSEAEVDDRVVNVSRFAVLYPERRYFFLVDADILEFGGLAQNGRPYFSRRVGADSDGRPARLLVGGRASGRTDKWAAAVLVARQEDPLREHADVGVARVKRNVGKQSYVGGILTYGGAGSLQSAQTVGVDAAFRRDLRSSGVVLESTSWGQLTSGSEGATGRAFGVGVSAANDEFGAVGSFTQFDSNFRPALGFVNRTGIAQIQAAASRRRRLEGYWKTFEQKIELVSVSNLDDSGFERRWTFRPAQFGFEAREGLAYVEVSAVTERLARPFRLLGTLDVTPGEYSYSTIRASVQPPGGSAVSYSVSGEYGKYYDWNRRNAGVGIEWTPSSHLALAADFQRTRLYRPSESLDASLFRSRIDVAFNTKWSFSSIAQYDTISRTLGINARLRWLPTPGQEAYLVFNRGDVREDGGDWRLLESRLVAKISYLLRF
jgi:hypothetical protein